LKKFFHCGKQQYQSDYYAEYKARLDKQKGIDTKITKEKQLAIDAIDKDVNNRLDGAAGFDLVARMLNRCSHWWTRRCSLAYSKQRVDCNDNFFA